MEESTAETKKLYLEMTQTAINKGIYQREWLWSRLLLQHRAIHSVEDYAAGKRHEDTGNVPACAELQSTLVRDICT